MSTTREASGDSRRLNRTLTVSLDQELREQVQQAAAESAMSTSGYLAMILRSSFPEGLPRVQHQIVFALLERDFDFLNNHRNQLLLQTLLFDCEVHEGDSGRHFGLVLGILEFGGHVESEVLIVEHFFFAQIEHLLAGNGLQGLVQYWLKRRVYILVNILQDDHIASRNRKLDCGHHFIARRVQNDQLGFIDLSLHALYPSVSLHLRVDHKRPASSLRHEHAIFFGKLIVWQPLEGPFQKFDWLHEEIREVPILRVRDFEDLALSHQLLFHKNVPVLGGERACVREKCGGH